MSNVEYNNMDSKKEKGFSFLPKDHSFENLLDLKKKVENNSSKSYSNFYIDCSLDLLYEWNLDGFPETHVEKCKKYKINNTGYVINDMLDKSNTIAYKKILKNNLICN
jgi:hypothetical protein